MYSGQSMKTIYEEYDLKLATVYCWKKEFETETGSFKDEATLTYEKEIKQLKKEA